MVDQRTEGQVPPGDRSYLSIGEVLSMLQDEFPDVTISKIRFLESQGLIDPERTPSGYRKFYPADIERLRFILHEQKEHFLPLKVIRDRLEEGGSERGDAGSDAARGTGAESAGDDARPAAATAAPPPTPAGPSPSAPPPAVPAPAAPAPAESADPPERLPVWMTQRTTRSRNPLLTGGVEGSGASYTAAELASASGLTTDQVTQAEQFGLLVPRVSGHERYYG